jgi:hypothetical protein
VYYYIAISERFAMRVLWSTISKSDDYSKISRKIIEFCALGRVMDCVVGYGEVYVLSI